MRHAVQARTRAQRQRGDRCTHGRAAPATAALYHVGRAHAQRYGVPFHQARTKGSAWRNLGRFATTPHAPGHNSLLPWTPEVLQTPVDAEWSQLSITLGFRTIGRVLTVIGFVTSPYRLRFLGNVNQSAEHGTLSATPSPIPLYSFRSGSRCRAPGGLGKASAILTPPFGVPRQKTKAHGFRAAAEESRHSSVSQLSMAHVESSAIT
jgi:hypothetical protein